ncbi:CRISPR system Cascade subunit CasB [Actinobaculum suis]|uniref:CRISPR system Cascade subunit CasB n=1 Tax=Actinobaculum suis TaxID=1657 RepID=A0A1G7EII6_9ACTO|nr:type I-E CRISPR-associated protein Cse2/CasB [Actinobaculum suis]MDY5152550.1 type I-E CRISPR-associated protein Cse2/CasB [Actinobaculum suis]SDE63285.1 CRISPR system Cascade subunit CasB [Actinobaculum suis]
MTQTLSDGANVAPEKNHLRYAVYVTCKRLQNGYLADSNSPEHHKARADLAKLRRYASLDISNNPLALAQALFVMEGEFGEKLAGHGDKPSPSEHAAYIALTLFAIHMQSASQEVYLDDVSFAQACGNLYRKLEGSSGSIKPRIDAMLLAGSERARLVHIRSLITMMRAQDIGFDYGRLAVDLRTLANPKKRAGVQLRWGRDFVRGSYSATPTPDQKHSN